MTSADNGPGAGKTALGRTLIHTLTHRSTS